MNPWDELLNPKPKPPPLDSWIEEWMRRAHPPNRPPALPAGFELLRALNAAKPAPVLATAFPKATRRKVFLSYHHENDERYKNHFEQTFGAAMDGFISKAVRDGDIGPWLATDTIRDKIRDDFIQDATVTVVLVGAHTWQRRHVDWEISASLRNTKNHKRCGLLGILLPTHPSYQQPHYDPGLVPPRLHHNAAGGYAALYKWSTDVNFIRNWIEAAFARRAQEPDNSYPSFVNNKTADRWM